MTDAEFAALEPGTILYEATGVVDPDEVTGDPAEDILRNVVIRDADGRRGIIAIDSCTIEEEKDNVTIIEVYTDWERMRAALTPAGALRAEAEHCRRQAARALALAERLEAVARDWDGGVGA